LTCKNRLPSHITYTVLAGRKTLLNPIQPSSG